MNKAGLILSAALMALGLVLWYFVDWEPARQRADADPAPPLERSGTVQAAASSAPPEELAASPAPAPGAAEAEGAGARTVVPGLGASSPASAEETASSGRVVVRVRHEGGPPVPGAAVEVSLRSGAPLAAATDAEGAAALPAPRDAVPVSVVVRAEGRATYRESLSDVERRAFAEHGEVWVEVGLRPAARLELRVEDDLGAARAQHAVDLVYVGARLDADGSPEGVRPPGANALRALTDDLGRLRLEDLDQGVWEVWCPPWRACDNSPRALVEIQVGQPGFTVLVVERSDPMRYADGSVELRSAARVEEGLVTNYALRTTARHSGVLLYAPDVYYLDGDPGEVLEAVLVEEETGITSAPFMIRIGEHDVRHELVWPAAR